MIHGFWIEEATPANCRINPVGRDGMRHCARHTLHHLSVHFLIVRLPRLTAPIQTMPTMDHRHAWSVGQHPAVVLDDIRLLRVGHHFNAKLSEMPDLGFYDSTYTAIICLRRNSDVVRG